LSTLRSCQSLHAESACVAVMQNPYAACAIARGDRNRPSTCAIPWCSPPWITDARLIRFVMLIVR